MRELPSEVNRILLMIVHLAKQSFHIQNVLPGRGRNVRRPSFTTFLKCCRREFRAGWLAQKNIKAGIGPVVWVYTSLAATVRNAVV